MRKFHVRLAILEERFIPSPNATRDEVIQRALAKLTLQELKLLMEAAKLEENGREVQVGGSMSSSRKKEHSFRVAVSYRYSPISGTYHQEDQQLQQLARHLQSASVSRKLKALVIHMEVLKTEKALDT